MKLLTDNQSDVVLGEMLLVEKHLDEVFEKHLSVNKTLLRTAIKNVRRVMLEAEKVQVQITIE